MLHAMQLDVERAALPLHAPALGDPLDRAATACLDELEIELDATARYLAGCERKVHAGLHSSEQHRTADLDAVLAREAPHFFARLDRHLGRLSFIAEQLPEEARRTLGERARKRLGPHLRTSAFLQRTLDRPRGYAGDSEMMIMVYENQWVGDSLFGKLMHRHALESAAAQAVRNRRALIAAELATVRARTPGVVRAMSVAAGPAWELQDILQSRDDLARTELTLVDQDPLSLVEAQQTISQLQHHHSASVRARLLRASVARFVKAADPRTVAGTHHFVYSMGLFDYLEQPFARELVARLLSVVEPGGVLLIGNYHVSNPTRHYMDLLMDWRLVHRTEEQLLDLVPVSLRSHATIGFEPSGAQMFLRVVRAPTE